MANDTTRMEAEARRWKAALDDLLLAAQWVCQAAPGQNMLRAVKQMREARDNFLAANPPEDQVTSLQRELAEARNKRDLDMLLCQLGEMATVSDKSAPAPSDVKGDGERFGWKLSEANACIRGIGVALGIDKPGTTPFGVGLDILSAIESLKSLASLTPLTDPSVRGVLVKCGERTRDVVEGRLYQAADGTFFRQLKAAKCSTATSPSSSVPRPSSGLPGVSESRNWRRN